MKPINLITLLLVIIGGVNWGLVGLANAHLPRAEPECRNLFATRQDHFFHACLPGKSPCGRRRISSSDSMERLDILGQ